MRLIAGLSKAQRIVVVVALGAAFLVLGRYLVSLGRGSAFGWYAYSPLTSAVYRPRTGLRAWLRLIIWLVLIVLWALTSVRVLRPPSRDAGSD